MNAVDVLNAVPTEFVTDRFWTYTPRFLYWWTRTALQSFELDPSPQYIRHVVGDPVAASVRTSV